MYFLPAFLMLLKKVNLICMINHPSDGAHGGKRAQAHPG